MYAHARHDIRLTTEFDIAAAAATAVAAEGVPRKREESSTPTDAVQAPHGAARSGMEGIPLDREYV